jgi:hypothetical protein
MAATVVTEKVKHTPGPWFLSHSGYANAPFVIWAGTRRPDYHSKFPLSGVNAIAEIFHDESPAYEQQEANARLIAAAPDMLDTLEAIQVRCACRELTTLDRDAQQLLLYIIEETSVAIRTAKEGAA